jgi:hypothetical protein
MNRLSTWFCWSVFLVTNLLLGGSLVTGCVARPAPDPDVRLFVSAPANAVISDQAAHAIRYPDGDIRSITLTGRGVSRSADLQWAIEWYQDDRRRAPGVSDRWRNFGTTAGLPFSKTAMAPNDRMVRAIVKVRIR